MPHYHYDHLHFVSSDPVVSARFYRDNFGAVIRGVRELSDGRTNVELNLKGWRFMLIDRRTPEETALIPSGGLMLSDTSVSELMMRHQRRLNSEQTG